MNFQKKILIIDGDQNFGDKIKRSLILHKYNVCYVNNGASGIKKAFEYNPDLILCEVNMDQIDGYHVYKVLNESLIVRSIPFVFLKQNASIEDIRHGMNLGVNDFFSKPISIHDLLLSIEIQLHKFKSNSNELVQEFNSLFQLSPNGTIVFNENMIIRANLSITTLLKIDHQGPINIKIEDVFSNSSLLRIRNWIQQSFKGVKSVFNEKVTIDDRLGEAIEMNMVISEFTTYSDSIQFIGFFTPVSPLDSYWINHQLANEVCNLLEKEKIIFPNNLGEKITNIIKHRTLTYNNQNNSFFTKREHQVLGLSMEGLPIKIIADRLSISSRTVEKYRTKLMEKTRAKNIVEVIVISLKNGLIKI